MIKQNCIKQITYLMIHFFIPLSFICRIELFKMNAAHLVGWIQARPAMQNYGTSFDNHVVHKVFAIISLRI